MMKKTTKVVVMNSIGETFFFSYLFFKVATFYFIYHVVNLNHFFHILITVVIIFRLKV